MRRQKTIMLLGAGPDQTIAIRIARSLGYRVLAVDGNPYARGLKEAHIGLSGDIQDAQAMIQIGKKYKVHGVMAHAVEMPVVVAHIAKSLGLPGLDSKVAERATNKLQRIERLKAQDVPCPKFETAHTIKQARERAQSIGFPCVCKPIDNSASRGVSLVSNVREVAHAYQEALSFSHQKVVLIEEYLQGHDLSSEAVVWEGKVYHTAFSDRNYGDTKRYLPRFVEDGGDMPTKLSFKELARVKLAIEQAIEALQIRFGAAKGDIIIVRDGPKILEMACRTSGGFFCSAQTPLQNGIQILKPLIQMSVGDRVNEEDLLPKHSKPSIERYVFTRPGKIRSIKGIRRAATMPGIKFVQLLSNFKRDPILPPTPTDIHKVAVVIGTGKSQSQARRYVQQAVAQIKVQMEQHE
ncbi:MAG: ATP-grasp domain-containing protein [Patescibacteria group bacterium]